MDIDPPVRHGEAIERRIAEDGDAGSGRARLLSLLGHQLGRHPAQIVLEEGVVIGLPELGELFFLLLGVAPELPLVGLQAKGLALIAHGREVGRGAA